MTPVERVAKAIYSSRLLIQPREPWGSSPRSVSEKLCIEAAELAIAAMQSGWQPIESAPKDGTKFDAWVPDAFGGHRMTGLSFGWRGNLRQSGNLTSADLPRWPTHWMPLPAPPKEAA